MELPEDLSDMHNVLHISQLKKYVPDLEKPIIDSKPTYQPELVPEPVKDKPIWILDWKIQKLRRKEIPLVRVEWRHGSTWEHEDTMKKSHPELFN